jgi:hypothetical protein
MTPKETADKLVNKYNYLLSTHIFNGTFDIAKQCALIAVDEILDASPMYYTGFEYESNLEYWQQVKTEIKKL